MNILFTLFVVLGVHNPFVPAPMPSFYVAPAPAVVVAQSKPKAALVYITHPNINQNLGTPAKTYAPAVQTYTKDNPPPQGWDATNAPGFGVTCFATTQCLNQAFGTPANDPSQGLVFTCPDGAPSQGSCQTPGGDK